MKKYAFRKYDPKYKVFFEVEKSRLADTLPGTAVEHVGSTAVPGLGGKGIVDIAVAVPKKNMKPASKALEEAGYEFRAKASTQECLFFRRDYVDGRRSRRVHIHLTSTRSRHWQEHIAFRDFLIKHPGKASQYARVKEKAARASKGNGDVYNALKKEFIEKVTELAL